MNMMEMAMRGMGIDPATLFAQVKQVGDQFAAMDTALRQIAADQRTIMVAMGLVAAAPELVQLAASESQKALAPYGGAAPAAFDVVT